MKPILLAILFVIYFTGCSYAQFKDGYKSAKVVYKDVRYVVYEVQEEKERVKKEGFNVDTSEKSGSIK